MRAQINQKLSQFWQLLLALMYSLTNLWRSSGRSPDRARWWLGRRPATASSRQIEKIPLMPKKKITTRTKDLAIAKFQSIRPVDPAREKKMLVLYKAMDMAG